jgi:hypothetical protein
VIVLNGIQRVDIVLEIRSQDKLYLPNLGGEERGMYFSVDRVNDSLSIVGLSICVHHSFASLLQALELSLYV